VFIVAGAPDPHVFMDSASAGAEGFLDLQLQLAFAPDRGGACTCRRLPVASCDAHVCLICVRVSMPAVHVLRAVNVHEALLG
jgi:hypothetical protein